MQDLRISLVQGETRWHDPAGNRDYYGGLIAPLAGQTDLVILPETFTSGFSNEAIDQAEGMDGAADAVEPAAERAGVTVGAADTGHPAEAALSDMLLEEEVLGNQRLHKKNTLAIEQDKLKKLYQSRKD